MHLPKRLFGDDRYGHDLGLNTEQWTAWAKNMGHEHVLTTITSYAPIRDERQAEIMNGLACKKPVAAMSDDEAMDKLAEKLATRLKVK